MLDSSIRKVYLAGPMRFLRYFNFPAFEDATVNLRNIHKLEVISPAEHDISTGFNAYQPAYIDGDITKVGEQEFNFSETIRWDLAQILTVDAVVVLPGWEKSSGAAMETGLARILGIPILEFPSLESVDQQIIIGFAGYAQAGKDTAAKILMESSDFERAAFADALKALAFASNPIVGGDEESGDVHLQEIVGLIGWEEAKKYGLTREFLQDLGVGARETVRDSIWVDTLFEKNKGKKLVITDVRFPNEVEAIKKRGGYVFHISRPGFGPVNTHISESAIDGFEFDGEISNDGSLEDFALNIKRALTIVGVKF